MSSFKKRLLRYIGPGIITGAADDDPSGIATYSQTGAQFGYGQLWTAIFMLPLLTAIQEVCARIGAVTGKGIIAVVKEHYNKPLLYSMVFLVFIANTDKYRCRYWSDGGSRTANHSPQFLCVNFFIYHNYTSINYIYSL